MLYELYLPFPPTVNSYYVKHGKGVYISNKGRKFRDETAEAVIEQLPGVHIDEPFLIEIVLFPPDRRKRDQDNYNKAILDSLTKSGLWEDDSLAYQVFNYKGAVCPGGITFVRISDAGPILPVNGKPPLI